MNQGNARKHGLSWRAETKRRSIEQELAFVGPKVTRQNLHERALTGAVLADHRQNLTRSDIEIDPVEREYAGESLHDVSSLKNQRGTRAPFRLTDRSLLAGLLLKVGPERVHVALANRPRGNRDHAIFRNARILTTSDLGEHLDGFITVHVRILNHRPRH